MTWVVPCTTSASPPTPSSTIAAARRSGPASRGSFAVRSARARAPTRRRCRRRCRRCRSRLATRASALAPRSGFTPPIPGPEGDWRRRADGITFAAMAGSWERRHEPGRGSRPAPRASSSGPSRCSRCSTRSGRRGRRPRPPARSGCRCRRRTGSWPCSPTRGSSPATRTSASRSDAPRCASAGGRSRCSTSSASRRRCWRGSPRSPTR